MPHRATITEIALRAQKPPERGTLTLWDGAQKHFGVRISQGGAKSFVVLLRSGRRKTIGRFPTLSLAQARAKAKEVLAEYALGKHRIRSMAYDDAIVRYLATCEKKNRSRTVRDYKRLLEKHFPFGRTLLSEITPEDIAQRVRKLDNTAAEQHHAINAAKIFFKWALRNRYIEHSPCEALVSRRHQPRERVLTEAELKAVLRTALDGSDSFSHIVALLILTGQRRTEIGSLQQGWINTADMTITLPSSITKNKRTHTFPYGLLTASVLERIANIHDTYLFPPSRTHVRGKPTTCFNGWPKAKEAFDKKCGVSDWTLHDLRRTFASNLAALGIALPTIEKLLNHVSGSFGGIVAVYQRHNWMPEMRAAIDAWENHLRNMLQSEFV